MKWQIFLKVIVCVFCLSSILNAQARRYLRIKERPIVRFDFECASQATYPKSKLNRIVKNLQKQDQNSAKWGDRAFAYDLNGDGRKEYFVPIGCGATGNCHWAILSLKPVRFLGSIFGENIYVHKRVNEWSRLTVSGHVNVSESMLETYHFKQGHYHTFGKEYLASAYQDNFPTLLLKVEPLCNPHYRRESRK